KREELVNYLKENGIATGVYYPVPLHLQKAYANLGYKTGDMPNAEYLSYRTFAIPMFAELLEEEKKYIVEILKRFGEQHE
ncbi:MAG TPA: DegT/DnrJ/EryC1/StrS family aminotransferase, partial [Sedimentibacter sp.]|nr:DegT/DnrJ/EryC1/StrS family aminotransferase [Sedimentibacter sp.]